MHFKSTRLAKPSLAVWHASVIRSDINDQWSHPCRSACFPTSGYPRVGAWRTIRDGVPQLFGPDGTALPIRHSKVKWTSPDYAQRCKSVLFIGYCSQDCQLTFHLFFWKVTCRPVLYFQQVSNRCARESQRSEDAFLHARVYGCTPLHGPLITLTSERLHWWNCRFRNTPAILRAEHYMYH